MNLTIPKFKPKPQSDPVALHKRFDGLSFFRLLDFSDESTPVREFIRLNYMTTKFALPTLRIRISDSNYDGMAYDNYIDIVDTERILKLFRNYGDLIRHLVYMPSARSKAADLRQFEDAIEKYLSATLTHYEQVNTGEHFIVAKTVKFPKVTYLHISRWRYHDNLRLEHIYPALEKLYYSSMDPFELFSLARRHRNLRSIKIREGHNFKGYIISWL